MIRCGLRRGLICERVAIIIVPLFENQPQQISLMVSFVICVPELSLLNLNPKKGKNEVVFAPADKHHRRQKVAAEALLARDLNSNRNFVFDLSIALYSPHYHEVQEGVAS